MNKVAYVCGYIGCMLKQGAKVDKLLRAGKLNPDTAHKYYKHLTRHPLPIINTVTLEPDVRKAVPEQLIKDIRAYRNIEHAHGTPTLQSGGLAPWQYDEVVRPFTDTPVYSIPAFSKTVRTSPYPGRSWSVDRGRYQPDSNTIEALALSSTTSRHELGHWLQGRESVVNPTKHALRARVVLAKLQKADPKSFAKLRDAENSLFAASPYSEIMGHYTAAQGRGAGVKLRNATANGWYSPWADRLRKKFPTDPALASVAEHLQRNYYIRGGSTRTAWEQHLYNKQHPLLSWLRGLRERMK
jgi:hypothetical protein